MKMKTTTIRIPDDVYEEIRKEGERNKRSVNAEINYRLEKLISTKNQQISSDLVRNHENNE
jgi:hypothetical protein